MVGAGIFALLGQAAMTAGSGVYASFLVAGLIALLFAGVTGLGRRTR